MTYIQRRKNGWSPDQEREKDKHKQTHRQTHRQTEGTYIFANSVFESLSYDPIIVLLNIHITECKGSEVDVQLNVTLSPSIISWESGRSIIIGPAMKKVRERTC